MVPDSPTSSQTQVLCGSCGSSIPWDVRFCPHCGAQRGQELHTTGEHLVDDLAKSFRDVFEIKREIGRGGLARVFLAYDRRRRCELVLKLLRPEIVLRDRVARFFREIEITRGLRHVGILPLFDSGEMPSAQYAGVSYPYFTLPFVSGRSLEQLLSSEGPLPIKEVVRIASAVADALQYAHHMHVIHRDVKPSNILLSEDGRILLSDFGIALALSVSASQRLTDSGVFVGTPTYMSPEQITSKEVDGRSDQYALACVVYEMLTGREPFQGANGHATILAHLNQPAPSPREQRSSVPANVEHAVLKALEKTPGDRFRDMAEFAEALALGKPSVTNALWGPLPERVDEKRCFVIMPFGDLPGVQQAYRDHMVPVIESLGLRVFRADDIFGHREVIKDIWKAIGEARLVVADVTGRNPNVFYELGLAHAIGKDVIILTQRGEDVPFDVTHLRYIKYEYTPRGMKQFEADLRRTIDAVINQE